MVIFALVASSLMPVELKFVIVPPSILSPDNSFSNKELFFDLENIAFSHASCNYAASRARKAKPCPSVTAYRNGCRCEGCLEAKREYRRKKKEFKNQLDEKKL